MDSIFRLLPEADLFQIKPPMGPSAILALKAGTVGSLSVSSRLGEGEFLTSGIFQTQTKCSIDPGKPHTAEGTILGRLPLCKSQKGVRGQAAPPLSLKPSYVICSSLVKSFPQLEPQFPHLQNEKGRISSVVGRIKGSSFQSPNGARDTLATMDVKPIS